MHKEDLKVVETFSTEPQNTDLEGDDEYVTDIIRKNQVIAEEPDELS